MTTKIKIQKLVAIDNEDVSVGMKAPFIITLAGSLSGVTAASLDVAITESKKSQDAAKVSETNAKASELAAKASQTAAKTSETNAKTSETNAAASRAAAAASQTAAAASQTAAKTSETNAKTSETNAKTSETNAAASRTASATSQTAAAASQTAAKTSETNAKTSETNAKTSETNAAASRTAAAASQVAAKTSETNAATTLANTVKKDDIGYELGNISPVNGKGFGRKVTNYPLTDLSNSRMDAGTFGQDYLVLLPNRSGHMNPLGFIGRMTLSRGQNNNGNNPDIYDCIVQSSYNSPAGNSVVITQLLGGGRTIFQGLFLGTYEGVEYLITKLPTSGGGTGNGSYFDGIIFRDNDQFNVLKVVNESVLTNITPAPASYGSINSYYTSEGNIPQLPDMGGVLPLSKGGLGGTTAAAGRTTLELDNVSNVPQLGQYAFPVTEGSARWLLFARLSWSGTNSSVINAIVSDNTNKSLSAGSSGMDILFISTKGYASNTVLNATIAKRMLQVTRIGNNNLDNPGDQAFRYGLVSTAAGLEVWVRQPPWSYHSSLNLLASSGNVTLLLPNATTSSTAQPTGIVFPAVDSVGMVGAFGLGTQTTSAYRYTETNKDALLTKLKGVGSHFYRNESTITGIINQYSCGIISALGDTFFNLTGSYSNGALFFATGNTSGSTYNEGRLYTTLNPPTAADVGAYTKEEGGVGSKNVTIAAPVGVTSGKYYPIMLSGIWDAGDSIGIATKASVGSDPMNFNGFTGTVNAGGWSDRPNIVSGYFAMYDRNERSLHSIVASTEGNGRNLVVYVEARAFPVRFKVPVNINVVVSTTDVSFDSAVFKWGVTNPTDTTVHTNVKVLVDFSKGNGLYNSGSIFSDNFIMVENSVPRVRMVRSGVDVGTMGKSLSIDFSNSENLMLYTRTDSEGALSTGQKIAYLPLQGHLVTSEDIGLTPTSPKNVEDISGTHPPVGFMRILSSTIGGPGQHATGWISQYDGSPTYASMMIDPTGPSMTAWVGQKRVVSGTWRWTELLKRGDYGLGTAGIMLQDADSASNLTSFYSGPGESPTNFYDGYAPLMSMWRAGGGDGSGMMGQLQIGRNGYIAARFRNSSNWTPWKRTLMEGDFGLGTASSSTNWDTINGCGFNSFNTTTPSYLYGINIQSSNGTQYGHQIAGRTHLGLFHRGVENGVRGEWNKIYDTKNTTTSADGTLKVASPVVKLFSNGDYEINEESEGCVVTRESVGQYLITGSLGLNSDAKWGGIDGGFDVPKDRNGQNLVWLDYKVNSDGSVLVKTYHRTYPNSPEFARNSREGFSEGDPIDIPVDQFVSVRVEMPSDSIYNTKMKDTSEGDIPAPETVNPEDILDEIIDEIIEEPKVETPEEV